MIYVKRTLDLKSGLYLKGKIGGDGSELLLHNEGRDSGLRGAYKPPTILPKEAL